MPLRFSPRMTLVGLSLLVAIGAAAAACSDGGESSTSGSATPSPATASPEATASQPLDIRKLDLASQADVKAFVQSLSGEVMPEEIIYADLTGDGLDDAIVPVSSGGTQGDIGFIVVGYVDGDLKPLLSDAPEEGEVRVGITGGLLVETLPVYAEGDTPGFPSSIKNIYYAWKGDHFIVDHEVISTGPNRPPRP